MFGLEDLLELGFDLVCDAADGLLSSRKKNKKTKPKQNVAKTPPKARRADEEPWERKETLPPWEK